MLRFRPMPLFTLVCAVAFAILIALGNWQWRRYEEKLRAAATAPIVAEALVKEPPHGPPLLVFGVIDGRSGWRLFVPTSDAAGAVLFIDAGFAPGVAPPDRATLATPSSIAAGRNVRGAILRPRPPGMFAPQSEPARGIWYAVDLPAMAHAAGYARAAPYVIAAPYVDAEGRARPNPFAQPSDPLPPQRHAGYAVTWWGLAAGLLGVYFAMHRTQGRLSWEPR